MPSNRELVSLVWTRKRTHHHKVRTGCLTCKVRRVKCGEERPYCQRCVLNGHVCRGYADNTLIHITPTSYRSNGEATTLSSFLTRTSPMLSLWSGGSEYWSILLPQASWEYAEVRHMVLALGLLDQYLHGDTSTLVVEKEFKQALTHYSQACRGLATGKPALHNILLTSVGAWTFELILNNFETAAMHFQSAQTIVKELGDTAEDDLIVATVRETEQDLHYQEMKIAEGILTSNLPQFDSLAQARQGIEKIIENLLNRQTDEELDHALEELTRWRLSFDQYKFTGPEKLGQKRSVFLLHNMLLVFIKLQRSLDREIAKKQVNCLLLDADKIMESPHVGQVEKGLKMILGSLIAKPELDLSCRERAQRLHDQLGAQSTA